MDGTKQGQPSWGAPHLSDVSGGEIELTVAGEHSPPTVQVVDLAWPDPHSWSPTQHSELIDRLQRLASGPETTGIILTGGELYGSRGRRPATSSGHCLDALLRAIAESRVPIIAAIPGDAEGAGLELAVACAARVAAPGKTFGFPGIRAARLPAFETLKGLPKLVGVEAAASIVALGRNIDSGRALELGLLDALADCDLLLAARSRLSTLQGLQALRTADPDPAEIQAQFFLARRSFRRETPGQVAPLFALRAMEAAAQPRTRPAAAEVERICDELSLSEQGTSLRYAQDALDGLWATAGHRGLELSRIAMLMQWPMVREALHLLDEGASPAQIDRCFTEYGFAIGPFAKSDARGFASVFSSGDNLLASGEAWVSYSPTLDLMVDCGRLGGESLGWFGPNAIDGVPRYDSHVDQLIQSSAISQRLHRKAISDQVIMNRCLCAAINASFAALGQCGDLSMRDIDAIWVSCLEFPRWKGGPLYQAQIHGLEKIVADLKGQRRPRDTIGPVSECLVAAAARSEREAAWADGERTG